MKTQFRYFVGMTALTGLLLTIPPAQGQEVGQLYFAGDVGGSIFPDTDLEEYFGQNVSGSEVKFDPGIRLGFRAGYGLTDWFALEGETGLMANEIDSIDGASDADAVFSNVPFMLNARVHFPQYDRLTPYFGGGVGGSVAVLDADDIVIGGGRLDGNMSDVVFAYQGFAGLRYKLNENMGLSVEYRYFATLEPEWEPEEVFGPASSDDIRFGRIQGHMLSIAIDFRF